MERKTINNIKKLSVIPIHNDARGLANASRNSQLKNLDTANLEGFTSVSDFS